MLLTITTICPMLETVQVFDLPPLQNGKYSMRPMGPYKMKKHQHWDISFVAENRGLDFREVPDEGEAT